MTKPIIHEAIELTDFIKVIEKEGYRYSEDWYFRGQADQGWPLIPKAGRVEYFREPNSYDLSRNQLSGDLNYFERWKDLALAVKEQLPTNNFDCLAFAQHYGLATRLLDWTTNPLVALFFAVETELKQDGAVFCYSPPRTISRRATNLYRCNWIGALLIPPHFDRRIVTQSGVFTYHHDPRKPIEPTMLKPASYALRKTPGSNLVEIKIPKSAKSNLQARLVELGVSRKSLFPDLDGVSAYLNWSVGMDNRYRPVH